MEREIFESDKKMDENKEIVDVPEKKIYEICKRIFDVIVTIIAIIFLSPIIIGVIIVIKSDSKGKSIFGHARVGKNGQEIKVYKFRTMVENASEVFENFTESQKQEYYTNFKLENDPRITKVGAFLRKTSLDELPQLFNVLKGDMSIVGPRPIVKKEIEKYGPYAEKFFSVIPGITGYWQANGRSNTTYEERVQMDMYYIDNRTFIMDIVIIFKTVISVIKKEGAV